MAESSFKAIHKGGPMYAVIRTGGKQFRVKAGDTVRVQKLDHALGFEFDLDEILLIGGENTFVGSPLVAKAKVTVVVTQQGKHSKIVVFKKKRRQGYRRLQGHRQKFTDLFVKSITTPDGSVETSDKSPRIMDPLKKEQRRAEYLKKSELAQEAGRVAESSTDSGGDGVNQKQDTAKPRRALAKKKTAKKKRAAVKTRKKSVSKAATTRKSKTGKGKERKKTPKKKAAPKKRD